jgi:hypothetical protein
MSSLMEPLRARRSVIAWLLLCLYLPACTSWHVGTPTPAEFVEREHPQNVRVTRTDSTTIELQSPTVRGDSLTGTVVTTNEGMPAGLVPAGRDSTVSLVSLALSDIARVEEERTSLWRSLVVAGAAVAGAILVVGLIDCIADPDQWGC